MIINHLSIDCINIRFKVVPGSITKFLTTGDNMKWRGKKRKERKTTQKRSRSNGLTLFWCQLVVVAEEMDGGEVEADVGGAEAAADVEIKAVFGLRGHK